MCSARDMPALSPKLHQRQNTTATYDDLRRWAGITMAGNRLPAMVDQAAMPAYCMVDRDVGRMRWMCIFSRSRHSGTRGAILVFQ
jgi:hypothetical protein